MSNLIKRTLSGAVYVAAVVLSIIFFDKVPYIFYGMFAVITCWAVIEYHILVGTSKFTTTFSVITSMLLYASACLYSMEKTRVLHDGRYYAIIGLILCALVIYSGLILQLFFPKHNARKEWGELFTAFGMYAIPFSCSILLISTEHLGQLLMLALYIIIWSNDTGAYCVGSLLGKHKLVPRISPGKTWEGLAGGVVFAACAAIIIYIVADTVGLWFWMVFALIVVVFGTLGDLMESLLKRSVGKKDSGHFLPGHGGVLDRFDSALLALPVIELFAFICDRLGILF